MTQEAKTTMGIRLPGRCSSPAGTLLRVTERVSILAVMYYCLYCFYTSLMLDIVSFNLIPLQKKVVVPLACVGIISFAVRLILEAAAAKTRKELLLVVGKGFLAAVCCIPCFRVANHFGYTALKCIAFAVLCLYGVSAERVLKVFVVTISTVFAATVLCALSGALQNISYWRDGRTFALNNLRSSYGILYPTNFASYLVFILLFFWSAWEGRRTPWKTALLLCLGLGFAYAARSRAMSNTSTFCLLLCCALIVYEALEHAVFPRYRITRGLMKLSAGLAVGIFPMLGLLFAALVWAYGKGYGFALRVNDWVHTRLYLTWISIQKYGLHLHGALTPQSGLGGSEVGPGSYEFLDSTYALLPIRYGLVLTVLATVLWVWIVIRALKNGRRCLAYSMAVIAVHSFSEHHFLDLNYNILMAMPLCVFSAPLPSADTEERGTEKGAPPWLPYLTGLVMAGTLAALLPGILARLRTFFALNAWTDGEEHSALALLYCVFCILLIAALWYWATRAAEALIRRENNRKALAAALAVAGLLACTVGVTEYRIRRGTEECSARLAADAEAIETVLAAAREPVYADGLEVLYRRRFAGFSDHVFTPAELARVQRGSIITDTTTELNKLLDSGAQYAELSEYTGIYTYDEAVARALKDNGYQVQDYYYSPQKLNLASVARRNGLKMTEDGALLLEGETKLLLWQARVSLTRGTHCARFTLSVDPSTLSEDRQICSLWIQTNAAYAPIAAEDIMSDAFDAEGHLTREIVFEHEGIQAVRFIVIPIGTNTVRVEEVSWRRLQTS